MHPRSVWCGSPVLARLSARSGCSCNSCGCRRSSVRLRCFALPASSSGRLPERCTSCTWTRRSLPSRSRRWRQQACWLLLHLRWRAHYVAVQGCSSPSFRRCCSSTGWSWSPWRAGSRHGRPAGQPQRPSLQLCLPWSGPESAGSGGQRRREAVPVPMLRNVTTLLMSALKTKPREPSWTSKPFARAWLASMGGSGLDIVNSCWPKRVGT
jgi:hypothetical protein